MSVGSGLYVAPNEQDVTKVARVVRQLIEGRSNSVGTFTVTNDGVATSTTVTAPTAGQNSIVIAFPASAGASTFWRGNNFHIKTSDVTPGQFVVTHAATSTANLTFVWLCVG